MKKIIAIVLCLMFVFALAGCGTSKNENETISFQDKTFNKSDLSKETIEWLEQYNALSTEDQLAINYIPADLYKLCGYGEIDAVESKGGDYPATINVNGTNYYSTSNAVPVEVDDSGIKYTTSYAENGVPTKDGEANFNRDTGTPYAVLEDGMVVVMIDNEWIEFKAK